jgi:hypothetical protein
MPKPEIQSLVLISEQIATRNIKITVVGDLQRVPKSILNRFNQPHAAGTIQLKQSTEINSWVVIKDYEEIMFSPDVSSKEVMIGIWLQGSNSGLNQLLQLISSQAQVLISRSKNIGFVN